MPYHLCAQQIQRSQDLEHQIRTAAQCRTCWRGSVRKSVVWCTYYTVVNLSSLHCQIVTTRETDNRAENVSRMIGCKKDWVTFVSSSGVDIVSDTFAFTNTYCYLMISASYLPKSNVIHNPIRISNNIVRKSHEVTRMIDIPIRRPITHLFLMTNGRVQNGMKRRVGFHLMQTFDYAEEKAPTCNSLICACTRSEL